MKKFPFILMAALLFLATSCDNDDDIENLQAIQSATFIPDYADGSLAVSAIGTVNLKCLVSPASALKGLTKDNFTVLVNTVGGENAHLYTLPVSSVDIDESLGMVKVEADIASILAEEKDQELIAALHIGSGATNYTSSFVNVATTIKIKPDLEIIPSVKQVEMTVVVPIHPSSLEYFNYIVRYSDNRGTLEADTVRYNGIGVEDYQEETYEMISANTRSQVGENSCYTRTFSYDDLPVTSTVTVEMIPRKESSSIVSFNFYTPKPYIFPNVHYSTTSVKREMPYRVMDGLEQIRIDNMSIGSFQSVYGTTFLSRCGVYNYADGYEYFFY